MAAPTPHKLGRVDLVQAGATYLMELVKASSSKYAIKVAFDDQQSEKDCFRYTVTFTSPTPQKPIPEAEAHVHFLLRTSFLEQQSAARSGHPQKAQKNGREIACDKQGDDEPEVVFWFETQRVKHTLKQTLPGEKLEGWIDRIIEAKLRLRQGNQLKTPFEFTRMKAVLEDIENLVSEQKEACLQEEARAQKAAHAPATREALAAAATEGARKADRERISNVKGELTPRMLYEAPPEKLCPEEVLQKVLHAADEDHEGLQRWDLVLLLAAAAHEDRDGYIHYIEFVEQAPGIIRLLRERRKMAEQRTCSARMTDDAIQLLYKDEMEETWRIMRDVFEAAEEGAAATGKLFRGTFLECLQSRSERLAQREITLLMQIAPTDEEGFVEFHAFPVMLGIIRRESINNAVLETNGEDLRAEILNALHKLGYNETSLIPLWTLREALNSTQLCLSRIQIHALLCMLEFDRAGLVECEHLLQTVCEVIPPLFDRAQLTEKAARIAKEQADAAARAELEELQGLTGGGKTKRKPSSKEGHDSYQRGRNDGYDDAEKGELPDKETVEKTLIHLFTVVDDKRRGTIPLQTFISAMRYWATSSTQQQNPRGKTAAAAKQQQDPPALLGSTAKAGTTGGATSSNASSDSTTPAASSKRSGSAAGGAPVSGKGTAAGKSTGQGGVSGGPPGQPSAGSPAAGSAAAAAERRYADVVASCKLSVEEVTGLIAELDVDERQQEVTYHEHIKTWIPTVFEIRKSPIFYQLIHNRRDASVRSGSSVDGKSPEGSIAAVKADDPPERLEQQQQGSTTKEKGNTEQDASQKVSG